MESTEPLRYERKFTTSLGPAECRFLILSHPMLFSPVYHQRYVHNIYFDTESLKCFKKNIDGTFDRFKIRIRWYEIERMQTGPAHLEIKKKLGLVGTKLRYPLTEIRDWKVYTVKQWREFIYRNELPMEVYEVFTQFRPTLYNCYSREYYLSADKKFRVTIDSDIKFFAMSANGTGPRSIPTLNQKNVLELKYERDYDSEATDFGAALPFRLQKMSKYTSGMQKVIQSHSL